MSEAAVAQPDRMEQPVTVKFLKNASGNWEIPDEHRWYEVDDVIETTMPREIWNGIVEEVDAGTPTLVREPGLTLQQQLSGENGLYIALGMLDSKVDSHWTKNGEPHLGALEVLSGRRFTRAEVKSAAPTLKRKQ